jgi:hypothetical protein
MASEGLEAALDLIRQKVDKAMESVNSLKRAANTLATSEGLPPVYMDADEPAATSSGLHSIRADQFTQYTTPSTAARAYLELRGSRLGATSMDDVFEVLKRGGYQFEGSDVDAKNSLRIALGKDAQVKRLPNGTYGLISWYGDRFKKEQQQKEKAAEANSAANGASAKEEKVEPTETTGKPEPAAKSEKMPRAAKGQPPAPAPK